MNTPLGDGQKAPYTLIETDDLGFPATPDAGDVVSVVASDPDAVTIVPDATPAAGTAGSGFVVSSGTKLATDVVLTPTLTKADGTVKTGNTVTIDVVAGIASGLSFGLGAPLPK